MDNRLSKSNRNYGIDLLRAVSMLMVVTLHILNMGGVLESAKMPIQFFSSYYLNTLTYCCVDCFVIISGYVLCSRQFRLSRFIDLWLEVLFWSVAISTAYYVVGHTRNSNDLFAMFFPIINGRWWYVNAYFAVFLFSPALNLIIRSFSKREFQLLLLSCFVVFGIVPVLDLGNDVMRIEGGYNFTWLIVLYLLGGYFHEHSSTTKTQPAYKYVLFFFLIGFTNVVYRWAIANLTHFTFHDQKHLDLFLRYYSPVVVGEAVCLFLFFKNISIRDGSAAARVISFVQPAVFAVYLIHLHPVIWFGAFKNAFVSFVHFSTPVMLLLIIISAVSIFVVCCFLDYFRIWIFKYLNIKKLSKTIDDWIMKTVHNWLDKTCRS